MERPAVDRIDRINTLVREEIAHYLSGKLEGVGLLSVVHVETQRDLSVALVYIVLHDAKDDVATLARAQALLDAERHEIWRTLREALSMKRIPRIQFILNAHDQQFSELEGLFEQIEIDKKVRP